MWKRKPKSRGMDTVTRMAIPAAGDDRFYGDGLTIHGSTELDVEVFNGDVVAVWFRCQRLPFIQVKVQQGRAYEMTTPQRLPVIKGVVVNDG